MHELLNKIKELRSKERLIKPDEAWVRATREGLLSRAQRALPAKGDVKGLGLAKEAVRALFPQGVVQYVSRPVFVSATLVVAALSGSMVSVNAAERSLPGDFLYNLKLVTEQAQIVLASSDDAKLMLKTGFVGQRADELRQVAAQPNNSQTAVELATVIKSDMNTLKQQLNDVAASASPAEAVAAAKNVNQQTGQVIVTLQESKQDLPASSAAAVTDAQSAAADTNVKAIEVLATTQQQTAGDAVSGAEVAAAINQHDQLVTDVTAVSLPVDATSSASGTSATIIITAPILTTSSTSSGPPIIPATLTLGSTTGSTSGTEALPLIIDQVKGATAQAYADQKVKDQAAAAAESATTGTSATPQDGSPIPANATSTDGTPYAATSTPAQAPSPPTSTKK